MGIKTDLCNLALDMIGSTHVIVDVDTETTPVAIVMRRWYDHCSNELLSGYPWAFATKTVAMTLSVNAPLPGWRYAYAHPGDCVNALEVTTAQGSRFAGAPSDTFGSFDAAFPRAPWRVSLSSNGLERLINTDLSGAYLVYVSGTVTNSAFPAPFKTALILRLGAAVAVPLRVNAGIAQNVMDQYLQWEQRARAFNQNQSRPDRAAESASITVRN